MAGRRFGVEEEFLLVDAGSGVPTGAAGAVLQAAPTKPEGQDEGQPGEAPEASRDGIETELQQEQLEIGTAPVRTLDELRLELRRLRRAAAAGADEVGVRVVAVATSPLPGTTSTTPDPRYQSMVDLYGLTASEQLTCGMHVHVETESPDEAVGALDRIRPWLAVLRAVSANSPYWQGTDTHYESFRTQAWSRWPTAGPTGVFGSLQAYQDVVAATLATGTLIDDGMVYFDARLGRGLPTLEVRVADVCTDLDDVVLVAALTRALVATGARAWTEGTAAPETPLEVLKLASWRASRSGTTETLVHPESGREAPAWDVIDDLVRHVRDALDEAGDTEAVRVGLQRLRTTGTGAAVQRRVHARTQDLRTVVLDAADRTARDLG